MLGDRACALPLSCTVLKNTLGTSLHPSLISLASRGREVLRPVGDAFFRHTSAILGRPKGLKITPNKLGILANELSGVGRGRHASGSGAGAFSSGVGWVGKNSK